jgi:hypothetical protein
MLFHVALWGLEQGPLVDRPISKIVSADITNSNQTRKV